MAEEAISGVTSVSPQHDDEEVGQQLEASSLAIFP
jgi:hypothetical protein